jgi:hypothetical protein
MVLTVYFWRSVYQVTKLNSYKLASSARKSSEAVGCERRPESWWCLWENISNVERKCLWTFIDLDHKSLRDLLTFTKIPLLKGTMGLVITEWIKFIAAMRSKYISLVCLYNLDNFKSMIKLCIINLRLNWNQHWTQYEYDIFLTQLLNIQILIKSIREFPNPPLCTPSFNVAMSWTRAYRMAESPNSHISKPWLQAWTDGTHFTTSSVNRW